MSLSDIIIRNLLSYMDDHNYQDYESFSKFIKINVSTFKCWTSKKRTPTLGTLDKICDTLEIPTYYLLIPATGFNADQTIKDIYLPNHSRSIISTNLKQIFITKHRYNWNDKISLFYGYFSIDTLKSYVRCKNYRTPPLEKISLIAECLGIEPYKLIMKGEFI
jgi:transcriptional regulator with XRE-family HTH domain